VVLGPDCRIRADCAGHTFCRQCLKTAAEKELTSCALCRKSHVLNPDILRAQFNDQRFANLSWRLGKPQGLRKAFTVMSWEAPRDITPASTPGSPSRLKRGKSSSKELEFCYDSDDDDLAKPKKAEADMDMGGDADVPLATGEVRVGRTSSIHLQSEAEAEAAAAEGGSAPASEAAVSGPRWYMALGRPGKDVGALGTGGLKRKWMRGAAMLPPDAGCASQDELRARWLAALGPRLPADCGALHTADLAARWTKNVTVAGAEGDVGSAPLQAMALSWAALMRLGVVGRDVGAAPLQGEETALAARMRRVQELGCLSDDCGAASIEALSARAALGPMACLSEDVGASSPGAMGGRWSAAMRVAGGGRRGPGARWAVGQLAGDHEGGAVRM
jgi:hypothetical protein